MTLSWQMYILTTDSAIFLLIQVLATAVLI